jgi:hypothetical protein
MTEEAAYLMVAGKQREEEEEPRSNISFKDMPSVT